MLYRYQKTLQEIYDEYLEKHKKTGVKPYPDKLLALLLLQEKDKYNEEKLVNGKFYDKYKKEIDEKIEKVMNDFELTKDDIIHFVEERGLYCDEENYEYCKIWLVFAAGFTCLIGTQRYNPSQTPEKAYDESYNCFYGQYRKENTNTRRKTLMKYKEKVRAKNKIK